MKTKINACAPNWIEFSQNGIVIFFAADYKPFDYVSYEGRIRANKLKKEIEIKAKKIEKADYTASKERYIIFGKKINNRR